MEFLEPIRQWFNTYPLIGEIALFAVILLVSWLAYKITHHIVLIPVKKIAAKSKTKLDDYLTESKALRYLVYLVPLIIFINAASLFPDVEEIITTVGHILLVFILLRSAVAFMYAINSYYETLPASRERPIKGYIQVLAIIMYIFGTIYAIGVLTGQSPWVIFSGIGALTAVILLVFKDTILSFVAGIQISAYDLLHVGDWIEMPQYGADGDVIEIALHTVKVQNWDKTITVIPTYRFTQDAYKNWRGMTQAGGRRIKRAVYIDQNSVKFCDEEMIRRFERIYLIRDYVRQKKAEIEKYNRSIEADTSDVVNGRRMTNLGTFRAYAEAYIQNHPKVNKNLTMMVRHLAPGPNGLPIEIYLFTNDIRWKNYEAIQADIFDHLLAVIHQFDLRIFQNPTGNDFRRIRGEA
ncbi:MAG TPA: mechanosensitive ion channel family protein [Caldithrix abyssi]|uniref:Mechanosensing system component YbdG n=1 Tax=Caldithrix abyssi TaxID=187145 RepID=A0A7V4WUJ8_CALAY|nr:mechanosensitive ion channel family protein [Caldithrix abyssi]